MPLSRRTFAASSSVASPTRTCQTNPSYSNLRDSLPSEIVSNIQQRAGAQDEVTGSDLLTIHVRQCVQEAERRRGAGHAGLLRECTHGQLDRRTAQRAHDAPAQDVRWRPLPLLPPLYNLPHRLFAACAGERVITDEPRTMKVPVNRNGERTPTTLCFEPH